MGPDPAQKSGITAWSCSGCSPRPLGTDTPGTAWGGLGAGSGHRAPARGALTLHPEPELNRAPAALGESPQEGWAGGVWGQDRERAVNMYGGWRRADRASLHA